MFFILPPSSSLIIFTRHNCLLKKSLWPLIKDFPWNHSGASYYLYLYYMLLCCFHAKCQPFQPLSLRSVLQYKLQRLKFNRRLVLMKHLKHNMSKTDWSSPRKPYSIHCLSHTGWWQFLPSSRWCQTLRSYPGLTHNRHPIHKEIPLALPSNYIQNLTISLHLHHSNSGMIHHHVSPGLLQCLLFKH